MNNEFVWTDELVLAFARYAVVDSPFFQGGYSDLEPFKAKHRAKQKSLVDITFGPPIVDWQILSTKNPAMETQGGVIATGPKRIMSAIRFPDKEIFEIGDITQFGTIRGFYIMNLTLDRSQLAVDLPEKKENRHIFIGELQKIKLPLFKTADGIDIREGDSFWYVQKDFGVVQLIAYKAQQTGFERDKDRNFSLEHRAREWALMNRPCLSINEVVYKIDVPAWIDDSVMRQLKIMVQTKIEQKQAN